mmetsp:Transcript_40424/g.108529  ORF Transcript_40424/g.108529 Transcript_40424/m.108529 type:complete len:378 (+) Transcript_40424:270-1403(+)
MSTCSIKFNTFSSANYIECNVTLSDLPPTGTVMNDKYLRWNRCWLCCWGCCPWSSSPAIAPDLGQAGLEVGRRLGSDEGAVGDGLGGCCSNLLLEHFFPHLLQGFEEELLHLTPLADNVLRELLHLCVLPLLHLEQFSQPRVLRVRVRDVRLALGHQPLPLLLKVAHHLAHGRLECLDLALQRRDLLGRLLAVLGVDLHLLRVELQVPPKPLVVLLQPGLGFLHLCQLLHVQAQVLGQAAVLLQDALGRHVETVHHLFVSVALDFHQLSMGFPLQSGFLFHELPLDRNHSLAMSFLCILQVLLQFFKFLLHFNFSVSEFSKCCVIIPKLSKFIVSIFVRVFELFLLCSYCSISGFICREYSFFCLCFCYFHLLLLNT